MEKKPIDIEVMLGRIGKAVEKYPKAAMFQLLEEGYSSLFEQLAACMVSIRTYDEVTTPAARRLFAQARSPEEISRLSTAEIDRLISPCTFHERKAAQIREIARRTAVDFGGELPCERDVLLSFGGVGIKCANLALGVACGQAQISVDVHVFRVTNRWGYVETSSPEKTVEALEAKLPPADWVEINRLLVPFGKHICTGLLPHCSTCPVLDMCQQKGVVKSR